MLKKNSSPLGQGRAGQQLLCYFRTVCADELLVVVTFLQKEHFLLPLIDKAIQQNVKKGGVDDKDIQEFVDLELYNLFNCCAIHSPVLWLCPRMMTRILLGLIHH